jgi:DNA-binding transcriptional regulator LsrR (DeoR family)
MKPDREQRGDDAVVFRIAQLFLGERSAGISPSAIAEQVTREFHRQPALTREAIYPLIGEAVRRGFLKLVPPVNQQLADRVSERFPSLGTSILRVVETAGPHDNAKVAAIAAEVAMGHLAEIVKAKKSPLVGVGLGPGRATLDFCRTFSSLLAGYPEPVKLNLVAISAGCPAKEPEYASTSFFNLFPAHVVASKVGLFAETLVPVEMFEQIKGRAGVSEAFAARESIDLVVTSMGDVRDEHDLLCTFLQQSSKRDFARLLRRKCIGNVQYRPYTATGPMKEDPGELRAVTLYELEDLVRIAGQKNKHVVLIARQCGMCKRTRAEALRPLLTNPNLKVFSTLVMDAATAKELLEQESPKS